MPTPRQRLWLLLALFGVLWLVAAVTSDGFIEADAWAHFIFAKNVPQHHGYLFDVWHRPICTGLYALAAPWSGMMGCRVIGVVLVFICVGLTVQTARALRLNDRLAAIFLLGQPMLFLHSLSVMTELPFAVLLIAAFLAYLYRRWWLMAFLLGLLPATRPEGFGFLFVGLIALAAHRKVLPIIGLFLPVVAWSWLGWRYSGRLPDEHWWTWLRDHWPYSAESAYGHGSIFQFVVLMPVLVGFGWPLVAVGTWVLSKRARDGLKRSDFSFAAPSAENNSSQSLALQDRINLLLVVGLPISMLAVHSLLWWLGKMASYGEIRYLLITAPFWAMLAAVGWERSLFKPSPTKLAVAGLLLIFACKVTFLRVTDDAAVAHQVRDWYALTPEIAKHYPRVIASHPAMLVYLDISPGDPVRYAEWSPGVLQHPADDSIVIWDPKCGPFNSDQRLVADVAGLQSFGWKTIETFPSGWVAMVKDDSTGK